MRPNLSRALVLATCALAGLAGCDSGGNASPNTLGTVPPTASTPESSAGTGDVDPGDGGSTLAPTSSVGSLPPGAIELSADGPWRRVDSAPGITQPGLVYELMPGLWVWLPTEEDIPNGITWVLNEADLPIIEAYLQARLVFYAATTARPMDLHSPLWSAHYVDGGDAFRQVLSPRDAEGQVFSFDAGIVLRPIVLGEQRTDEFAIVFDCMLDGSTWRLPDGKVAAGSTPGISDNGLAATLILSDDAWLADQVSSQPEACQ